MKNLAVLGSTGSIGRNTLRIVEMFPDRFAVKALTGAENVILLAEQIAQFSPELAVVLDEDRAKALKLLVPRFCRTEILYGQEGYVQAASLSTVDQVVTAMVGAAGLLPTLAAISAGKDIALANKETLVMAGDIVMRRAGEKGVTILPVDSEHSAIFQSMAGSRRMDVEKIFLTASGGPFLEKELSEFERIAPDDALKHPNWTMGKKITIDSATMMNKGLEVIEAKHLFGIPEERIEVVIHPQSIVHSMVGFSDGSVMAQMGVPDMKGAIAYALSWPERLNIGQPMPDFFQISTLTFRKPDPKRFPCLELAQRASEIGNTLPAVLNASNEIAVWAFLEKKIVFTDIPKVVEAVLDAHKIEPEPRLEAILQADLWAREAARSICSRMAAHGAHFVDL
jgi:1-deoxy-D-xylulose-5-phosphate reductoisomerase